MRKKTTLPQEEEITRKTKDIRWERLDNTAHLFPAIARENMTNVYRISVTLKDLINPELLQKALDIVLPKFDGFNLRLRHGVFWYYFEENGKPAPKVVKEELFPCRFIRANKNNSYLFHISYYQYRINLEVFHVLTDGMGGINFLRELTYQYLRLLYPDLQETHGDNLCSNTSLNREDSFLKNYKSGSKNIYKKQKAYQLKGEHLRHGEFGVIHVYMNIPQLKSVCKKYGASINEYLVSVFIWSIYRECLNGTPCEQAIRVAVPVNLRPFFNSITTKNFFAMVSAEFWPKEKDIPFEEVLASVRESLKSQINREHLEKLFSYNVSNQKLFIARIAPLPLKNILMKRVYETSALANTSTITNIGNIAIDENYAPYVENFHAFLSMSKGQELKGTICSYKDALTFSFSYTLKDASVQRGFVRKLTEDGINIELESNGVNYE